MATPESTTPRRKAVLFGAIVGAVAAIAAGATAAVLTLSSSAVASGLVTPTICDTTYDIDPGTPVWDDTLGDYKITGVIYSNVSASCSGESMKVNVLNGSGSSISTAGGIIGGSGTGSFSLTADVPVADWVSVASTIYSAP